MSEPLIVFVCTANVCRSPWAEARAAQLLDGYRVSSAGIRAPIGRPMDETMAATLPDGATIGHHAQRLTPSLAAEAGLLLTMDSGHRGFITEEFPAAIRRTFTLGQFVETARRAPSGLGFDEFVTWVYRNRVPSGTHSDVADPYKQGPVKARAAADQIEGLLTELAALLPGAR